MRVLDNGFQGPNNNFCLFFFIFTLNHFLHVGKTQRWLQGVTLLSLLPPARSLSSFIVVLLTRHTLDAADPQPSSFSVHLSTPNAFFFFSYLFFFIIFFTNVIWPRNDLHYTIPIFTMLHSTLTLYSCICEYKRKHIIYYFL